MRVVQKAMVFEGNGNYWGKSKQHWLNKTIIIIQTNLGILQKKMDAKYKTTIIKWGNLKSVHFLADLYCLERTRGIA